MKTMYYGLLINAAVSYTVVIVCYTLGYKIFKKKASGSARIPALSYAAFWMTMGSVYLFAASRTVAAFFGNVKLDLLFFYVDNFFGALLCPITIFFVLYFFFKNKRMADIISFILAIVAIVWWVINVKEGAGHHQVSFWLSEWEPLNKQVTDFSKYVLFAPSVLLILSLNFFVAKMKSRTGRYKLLMSSLSITGALLLMMADFVGTSPFVGFIGRVGIMLFTSLGFLSYFPTERIKRWLEE